MSIPDAQTSTKASNDPPFTQKIKLNIFRFMYESKFFEYQQKPFKINTQIEILRKGRTQLSHN